jgi:restriction endonuclease Mrr
MRGGGPLKADPGVFVDTSSYGRQGLDAVVRVLGIDALVLGSDRPYATPTDPHLGAAADFAVRVRNPLHLIEGVRP